MYIKLVVGLFYTVHLFRVGFIRIYNMDYTREKIDIEQQDLTRRSSDTLVNEFLLLKQDELSKHMLSLYGSPEPMQNVAPNKVLETKHHLNIENKILNFFIILFSIFIILQFSLISIVKLDVEFPSFKFLDYQHIFKYSYLTILALGKALTYLFLINFFIRCYIGIKLFNDKGNMLLFKLLNMQFMGFLSQCVMCLGIMGIDYLMKQMLEELHLLDDSDSYYNEFLGGIKYFTKGIDFFLYGVIILGLVLSSVRKLVRMMVYS